MINKKLMESIRADINSALKETGRAHGVSLRLGNGGYDRDGAAGHLKLNILPLDKSGNVISQEETDYKNHCSSYGLKPEYLGSVFSHNGEDYKVIGIRIRARKFPVLVTRLSDGVDVAMRADSVRNILNEASAA
jgi:hypothetical protein